MTIPKSITLSLDIFIHLMTSAYREGLRAGIQHEEEDPLWDTSAVSRFQSGMTDMLKEPESIVQH